MTHGPVRFDLDENAPIGPDDAPPVPEPETPAAPPAAMQRVASLAAGRPNRLARWFWGLSASLILFFAGIAAWDFVSGLLARSPVLGWIATALVAAFCLVVLAIFLRELAAFGRLRRVDRIQTGAAEALLDGDLDRARTVTAQIEALYRGRDDTRWGRQAFVERRDDVLDADGLLGLA